MQSHMAVHFKLFIIRCVVACACINGARCIHTNIHCTLNTCCTSNCYIAAMLCSSQLSHCHLFFAMKCKRCQQLANFMARSEGEPFEWWCKWCYDAHEHKKLPDDIEHQTLCIQCKDQPASCRIRSPLKACWEYWCYTCFDSMNDLIIKKNLMSLLLWI